MRIDDVLAALRHAQVRVSRRELLRLAALGGVAVSGGLGQLLGGSAAKAFAAPKRGGIWRMAIYGNPTAYPITVPGKLLDILVNKTIFSTLVKYELRNNQIQVVPDLAESWTANATLTEYTFKLRRGAKWHDGRPVTADDVKFTIDAQLNPKVTAGFAGVVSAISQTMVVDPATVKFSLKFPYASLPVMLGYNIAIVPKHLLEGQDLNQPVQFIQHPVGSGPFRFKAFAQDSHLEVEANKDYYGGAPLLDGIIFKVIPDGNARVAQLKAGEIDFTIIDPPQVAAVQGTPNIVVRRAPQVNYYFFAINHEQPKFADVRVRQALSYAIDRQAIVANILKGDGRVATGPINPLLGPYYNASVETYPYDLGKAQGLLAEAGWKKGTDGILVNAKGERFTLLFNGPKGYPVMEQVITYAQHQYQRLGIPVTLDVVDWPVHLQKYHDRKYDLIDGVVDHTAGCGPVRPLLQRLLKQLVVVQEPHGRQNDPRSAERARPEEAGRALQRSAGGDRQGRADHLPVLPAGAAGDQQAHAGAAGHGLPGCADVDVRGLGGAFMTSFAARAD